ncbi:ABC transporter ATP-binding protein [Actinoalloteichus hymeniacidonis]|uniref:ABC-type multidrug transport system, ATPase and permease component n=1 Tax=Actinoalloteichus hymeniacidonis TaxID=340345 RepID=A0AAC9MX31_9PSEU|nr:ABC transporter ATP-binding protein [Actinoalloteichus hymeniacidonis]AOS62818.1 ABC-type multidrug transport system, ATPase and permease component [Actinoalloteichus hymeniacidonis]MBB5909151.1 ATP-binding cassette subfamily B protein [Actinoalloteichus hymeniacidonis]
MTSTDSAVSEAGPDATRRPKGSLTRLLRVHLRPYRSWVTLVVVFQFGQMLAMLFLPTLNADIIDNGVARGDTGYILRSGGVMLGVTLLQIICAAGAVFFAARTAMAVGRDIRSAVFTRVQSFSVREIGRFGAPSLITRTTNDVEQVQMLVLMGSVLVVPAPIMGIGGTLLALDQDVQLSGLLLFILPALVITMSFIVSRMGPLARGMQHRIDEVNRVVREQITGIRVIRAFVRDEQERERFGRANTELLNVSLRFGRLMALMMPAVMLIMEFSSIAVMWFGSHRITDGSMQFGSLIAFLSYLMQILMAVMMATAAFMMTPRARVCAERVQEVLDTTTSLETATTVAEDTASVDAEEPSRGLLELSGVDFGYPGAEEPVLRSIDLVARPGETTAIIGSTGSGKTTLLNLIPRLADPTAGTVRINGTDIRELDRARLPGLVGLVPQKPYLFSGTIATNLRYGKSDATDAELWHALEVAQAAEFVAATPEGLDAPIGQGGTNVSGGQRQRLAIARLLVARPEIYLFDDSFSALDYATDAALRSALASEISDATLVIVAQRVSTIRDADRIVVLDEGRVVGTGTHSELMANNQTYREIVLSQLTEQEAS